MDKINLKKIKFKMLKKIMSGAILMGRPEYTKQIKWIFKFDLKLNAKNRFYKFDIRNIIICFHNKTRLDNVSSFVSFEKSR